MRRDGLPLLCSIAVLLCPARFAYAAAGCATTPDAAVLQALSEAQPVGSQQVGFRVRDIVVDPLLHRAFVHVEQCSHPERPLVLLPFAAAHEARTIPVPSGETSADGPLRSAGATVPSGSFVTVAMGDAHMHLTVHGRLLEEAVVGSDVEVQLAALEESSTQPSDARKRVRGRLTAANRVEVQP